MVTAPGKVITHAPRETALRGIEQPAPRSHRLKAIFRIFIYGGIRLPMAQADETKSPIVQWPVFIFIAGIVMMGFSIYRDFNRESLTQVVQSVAVTTSQAKDIEYLKSENVKKDAAILALQEDYKVVDTTLNQYRLDLARQGKITIPPETLK